MKEKEARRKPAKETLRTNIKDYIQKQIAAGVYRPGDRIVETQLAREMNVSQAPVREAILEMVALGMLEERPYSGHFVRALGPKEIEDMVMDAAESAALKRAWSMLRMAEWTYIAAAITKSSLEEMIQQHWTIFRYLEARQAHSAGAYMYLHIKGFGEEVSQHFADQKKKEL